MKIKIRKAVTNDIELIAPLLIALDNLHLEMYPNIFDEAKISLTKRADFLLKNIDIENSLFLLAENEVKIVGIVHCYIQETKNHPIKKDNTVAVLSDLFVDRNFRNIGIARQLVEQSLSVIKENWQICSVILNVFDENHEAIKLYENLGFEKQFTRYSLSV